MSQMHSEKRNPYVGAVLVAGLLASVALLIYGLSGLI